MSRDHYSGDVRVNLTINDEVRRVVISPSDTLVHTLRTALGLTGTKIGCENGDCGACTVQIDGIPTKSCVTLTLDVLDRKITTIEGLRESPVQRAFVEESGLQCGFCTPGLIMNSESLIRSHGHPDTDTSREWLESNICRCTGYENIQKAVARAADEDTPDQ